MALLTSAEESDCSLVAWAIFEMLELSPEPLNDLGQRLTSFLGELGTIGHAACRFLDEGGNLLGSRT